VVFVATDGTLQYVDDVGGTNTVRSVVGGDGADVSADTTTGVA
jgi:hypothetical protein